VTAFVEGPDSYLNAQGITLPSAVDPAQVAVIDAEHCVFLNYEVFYFASDELRQKFLADRPGERSELAGSSPAFLLGSSAIAPWPT